MRVAKVPRSALVAALQQAFGQVHSPGKASTEKANFNGLSLRILHDPAYKMSNSSIRTGHHVRLALAFS